MPGINPENLNEIANLQRGQFAYPLLNWNVEIPNLENANKTIKSIATNMSNRGFDEIIQFALLNNENLNPELLENLIQEQILVFLANPANVILTEIFHLIQLWGGNSGRMFYFKGANIHLDSYSNLINCILQTQEIDNILQLLKTTISNSSHINIAFFTKHIAFWQRFGTTFSYPLPIYDSIMAKNLIGIVQRDKKGRYVGFTNNDFKHLKIYWENMIEISNQNNISSIVVERQIFNHFRVNGDWIRNY